VRLKQITILGVGLLGGSIGLGVRAALPKCKIVGWGHRIESLKKAELVGAIDRFDTDAAAAVEGSDLTILCTPVGTFRGLLREIAPSLDKGILTDVGSTKRSIVAAAKDILGDKAKFVASHPIAGSEKRGVEFARADLFQGAICIVTPTRQTPPAAVKFVESFWKLLGMRIMRLDAEKHDRLLADMSHLPHVVAAALVAMQEDAALELCGTGFLDATRIAGGDGGLWKDILLDNAGNLRDSVARLHEQISRVLKMLNEKREGELVDWLSAAAQRRAKLVERKLRQEK
jgi:prephenate dehydrogenase